LKTITFLSFIFVCGLGVSGCGWLDKSLNLSGRSTAPAEPTTLPKERLITEFKPSVEFIEQETAESRSVTLTWASTGDSCELSPSSTDQSKTLPGSGSLEVIPERSQKYSLVCTKQGLNSDTSHTWIRVSTHRTKLRSCTDLLVAVPNADTAFLYQKSGSNNGISVPNGTLLTRTALLQDAEGKYEITLNKRAFTILSNFVRDPCDATKDIVRTVEIEKDTTFTEIGGIRKCNFEAGDILRVAIFTGTESESSTDLIKVSLLDASADCEFSSGSFLKTDVRTGFGYEGKLTETGLKIAEQRTRVRFNTALVIKTATSSGLDQTLLEWTTSNAESCTSTRNITPTPTPISVNRTSIWFDGAIDTSIRITCDGPGGPVSITPIDLPVLFQ